MYQSVNSNFTGFKVTYPDGSFVLESPDNSVKGKRTNWHTVDTDRIETLELFWGGISIVSIDKKDHPEVSGDDWFFSHTGYTDIDSRDITVVSRNIGFREDGALTVFSVDENDGTLRVDVRV